MRKKNKKEKELSVYKNGLRYVSSIFSSCIDQKIENNSFINNFNSDKNKVNKKNESIITAFEDDEVKFLAKKKKYTS